MKKLFGLFDTSGFYILHIIANVGLLYLIMYLTTDVLKFDIFKLSTIYMILYFSIALYLSDSIVHRTFEKIFNWYD